MHAPKWLFFVGIVFLVLPLSAQTVSTEVHKKIQSALSEKSTDVISGKLIAIAKEARTATDKKYALSISASFLERSGNLIQAGETYRAAALSNPSARDDSLFLDSARCALAANDTETANTMVGSVLLTAFEETILLRARVYAAWIQLASGDQKNALELLRAYAGNAQFEPYIPAILFTLWWGGGDAGAEKALQKRYPDSAEAAAARGEVGIGPSAFWYLMTRDGISPFVIKESAPSSQETALEVGEKPKTSKENTGDHIVDTPISTPTGSWQQTGFFKNREYAESLAAQLRKRGFSPVIRKDTRPSGTVYFAVLIPDDGKTAARLKDAGFESYLVTD